MASLHCTRNLHLRAAIVVLTAGMGVFQSPPAEAAQWYKAALHQHTAWSDGLELPELAAYWYKTNGYNFFTFTDHYSIVDGASWKDTGTTYASNASITRAASLFGSDWNVTRTVTSGTTTKTQLKLKTLSEIKAKLDESGTFLAIQGQEITSTLDSKYYVHVNAWNLSSTIAAATGTTSAAIINKNLAAVTTQAASTGRTILSQINHPNAGPSAGYAISAEDMAQSTAQFIEVCNAGPDGYYYGNSTHPSTEKLWDIANTIRLGTMKEAPLYGTGADDTHIYNATSTAYCNPGRAWTTIRADSLSTDSIFTAMTDGDFYASTGVTLSELAYDSSSKTLSVAVDAESGVNYRIDFIGTLKGVDPTKDSEGTYSSEIGTVLSSVTDTSASYTLTGDELYVRAYIYSDKAMDNPSRGGVGMEQAWTQPVGWTIHAPEPGTIILLITGLLAAATCCLRKRK